MDQQAPRLCEGILNGSRRIATTIESLKGYGSGGNKGPASEVDINEVIRTTATLLWYFSHNATSRFTLGLNEEIPSVKGDRYQLEQLFINLLMNAFQSLESKLAAVTVKSSYDTSIGMVVITVEDEGRGMTPEVL
jgi:two-component system sensor kinase FixL